jgi:hypothetical protein
MSIDFCHICPTNHLHHLVGKRRAHLALAHLVEADNDYAAFYKSSADGSSIILDNSAFEMYKLKKPMYEPDKLVSMGHKINASYIVMSDYPNEPGSKTIQAAIEQAPEFRKNGFKTFFVPQSRIGDIEDFISTFAWAASSPLVDYIGVSILGVPNAYGVESGNKLQRYVSRTKMMTELKRRGLLALCGANSKKIHFLGMVDGPNEIDNLGLLSSHVDTWDSSAAVWCGLNGIEFDNSPTGLINGKFEEEVDFNFSTEDMSLFDKAKKNIEFIDRLCGNHSEQRNLWRPL